jgi:prepilin peptidase CpaA
MALAALGVLRIGAALVGGESALTAGLDLAAAVAVFTLAALAFRFGLLGGGDVKLLAAGTLWLGAAALGPYLIVTVLAGGLMAVAFAAWHFARPGGARRQKPSLPYAIAIAAGGILTTAGALWA